MFDEVAHTARAKAFPEGPHGIADDRRVGAGSHCRRPWQVEDRADLAEVVSAFGELLQFFAAAGQFADDLELALGDDVDQVAHRPLLEEHIAGFQLDSVGWPFGGCEVRDEFDDAIGKGQNPAVVGRDDHHPVAGGEFTDEPQYLLDLDEVQVRGGFVGQYQGRIERDRARDRDSLLLAAAEIARPVRYPLLQADAGSSCPARLWAARRGRPDASSGTMTFSSAVRLGTRLNA